MFLEMKALLSFIPSISKRRGSSALAKDDYDQPPSVHNSTYGDPRPEIHRNIDTTAMSKNAVSFLEETPASNEYFVWVFSDTVENMKNYSLCLQPCLRVHMEVDNEEI